jgi:hypothetical protein
MPPDWIDKWIEAQHEATPTPDDELEELPSGPPLTELEALAGQRGLEVWQSPDSFHGATKAMCSRCESAVFFGSPKLKFLHDAHVLGQFALMKSVEAVRLVGRKDQWPDGLVRLGGKQHSVEITSTHGGRKLGEEYRRVRGPTLDPIENWIERADSIPKYLDEAIALKIRKKYSSTYWLVVYLNIGEYGIRQIETERAIAETQRRYNSEVVTVHVIWKHKLY